MSDTIRTRIAKVLHRLYGPSLGAHPDGWDREPSHSQEMYLADADAVICELHQQWRADYGYDGYETCETRDEAQQKVANFNTALGDDIRDGEQAMVMHRYVTDWVSDD